MRFPIWQYDELRQVGIDFEDVEQVTAYDAKQGSDPGVEQALIKRLGVFRGAVVVDLGCGTASFARAAAQHGAVVHAVDVSQAMLDYARGKARAEDLSRVEFHRAGFLTFSPGDRSVDFIVSRFALHHLPDFWKQVALVRLAGMLRSGGRLFLRDVAFSFPVAEYERAISGWIEHMPRVYGFSRGEAETQLCEEHTSFKWVLDGMLERAGFEVLESLIPEREEAEWLCRRP